MSLWGSSDRANNAPKFQVLAGTKPIANGVDGFANTGSDPEFQRWVSSYGNTTPDVFTNGVAFGVFGVDATESSVGRSNGKPVTGGWNAVRVGTGPIATVGANNKGSSFANGETITISGGSGNATVTITTNAAGLISSLALTDPGYGFTNVASLTVTFNREKHVTAVTGNTNAAVVGYDNTSIVVISNGTVNATASLSTNATGGLSSVTVTSKGLFANTKTAGQLAFTVGNSSSNSTFTGTTGIVGNTSTATAFSATLGTSSSGSLTGLITLGGHAGRIQYESLVAMHITSENTGDNAVFPNS